jgi:DNA-binding Xre family transcriptional regulator
MTHHKQPMVTLEELFEMAIQKQPNMSRLSRECGVSRATLYRVKNHDGSRDIEFATYGKLARFVLEGA